MNWEVANETKTLNTGNYQIKMIKYIDEKLGLNTLTDVLKEAAMLRLNNPEDSLQSLADMINISKSGIRNRFRRIEEVYNSLLEEEKNSSLKIKSMSILTIQFLDEKRRNGLCQLSSLIKYLNRSLTEYKNIA